MSIEDTKIQEPHPSAPIPGGRFRRNVVAVGAALGLTLAGLGFAGAEPDGSGSESGTSQSAEPAAHGEGRRGGHHFARGVMLETAAEAIGITAEELRTELKAGKSIATVANEHSVDAQKVVDALVAEAQSNLEERMTNLVNRTPGEGRPDRAGQESEPTAA